MSARTRLAVVVIALTACRGSAPDSPWLAPDALDAETWGRVCGSKRIPSFEDPRFPSTKTEIIWASPSGAPATGVQAQCVVTRDKETGRLDGLSVSVGWWIDRGIRVGAAVPTIERLRTAVLAEVSPRHRPWVLFASLRAEPTSWLGLGEQYSVTGAYDLEHGVWMLGIVRRGDR